MRDFENAIEQALVFAEGVFLKLGIPSKKMGIGMGFYGACWGGLANGPREATNNELIKASDNKKGPGGDKNRLLKAT